MNYFVTSMNLSPAQASHFFKLVGKAPGDIRFALIENAADTATGPKDFVLRNRKAFANAGIHSTPIDLHDYKDADQTLAALQDFDVIWLSGGNCFYLRWLLRQCGFDKISTQLSQQGVLLAGASAGAIVLGPTLKHFEAAKDMTAVPEVVHAGLGLITPAVLPHWANAKYGAIMQTIENNLLQDGFETLPLTDTQAAIITDQQITITP